MKRRGFLGSLFALPAAAKALAEPVHTWDVVPLQSGDIRCATWGDIWRVVDKESPYGSGTFETLEDGSLVWRNR